MISAINPFKQAMQVTTLRECSGIDEKVNQVAIEGLKDAVVTVYKNTAQISDFFSVKILDSKTQLLYQPILPGMDQSSTFIHMDKGEGFIQSYKVDNKSFSMGQFYQSLVGKEVKLYNNDGDLIEGKVIEWSHDTLTLYDTKYAPARIVFYKRDEIKGIQCMDLETQMAKQPSLKANYLTEASPEEIDGQVISLNGGFSWQASYRLVVEETKNGLTGKLMADAQISNRCGKDLKNVVVKVVSGNLNLEMPAPLPRANYHEYKAMPCASACTVQTAAIDQKWQDLKAYLIPYKMDLLSGETLSTRLFDPKEINLVKSHVLHSHEHESGERHPHVCYHIENTKENHLDQAFPDGKVQVFRKDDLSIDLMGQHRLEQTPRGKDLKILTSESFDLVAKRSVQVSNVKDLFQKKIAWQDCTVRIELTNGSDEDKIVFLHEHLSKGYALTSHDKTMIQDEGQEIVFEVKVPKNTTAKEPLVVSYEYRRDFI